MTPHASPLHSTRPASPRPASASKSAECARDTFTNHLIGESVPFREAVRMIQRVASFPATVLIQGETGTGKELAARAIHYLGPNKDGPFVPVNCGAIPDGLCENELFGHARGAYTGAQQAQPGIFAMAEGGTLFLDEIECLSLKSQATLLRVMQDQSYRPLGGAMVQGKVRIIAASNRDLAEMVRNGELRQDFYYRLSVLSVVLPSLRHRGGDIPILARHFIRVFANQYQMPEKRLGENAERLLMTYSWPGNVRELENFIHREFLLCDGPVLEFEASSFASVNASSSSVDIHTASSEETIAIPRDISFSRAKAEVVATFERQYLMRLMVDTGGNVSLAARLCGKERRTLGRLLKKHGLNVSADSVE
ncbi:MAG TPA: sigma-54 dependent transcriptional regulator [Burkholderiales bacterium]|nr:sigma-54 dependent transcriptional regulator [Burkholderiales bacterium]